MSVKVSDPISYLDELPWYSKLFNCHALQRFSSSTKSPNHEALCNCLIPLFWQFAALRSFT